MQAVTLDYVERAVVRRDVPEPILAHDREVLFRVHEVGVCGTDRELSLFNLGRAPQGSDYLVLGHEAVGEVVACGSGVRTLKPGDWVAPMIRRACSPACVSCARHRRDLCVSGRYSERGIFSAHGYWTRLAVDSEEDLLHISEKIVEFGVLIEPLSVVEKAVESAFRLHEPGVRSALVIGAGPIGILAALVLQRRKVDVTVYSLESPENPRAQILRDAGICYTNNPPAKADIVIEASGSPKAVMAGLHSLAPLGVLMVLGAFRSEGDFPLVQLIVENQIVAGSVNAAPQSALRAVQDLEGFDQSVLRRMIHRLPFGAFEKSLKDAAPNVAKFVHVIE